MLDFLKQIVTADSVSNLNKAAEDLADFLEIVAPLLAGAGVTALLGEVTGAFKALRGGEELATSETVVIRENIEEALEEIPNQHAEQISKITGGTSGDEPVAGGSPVPGTPEHKELRWNEYQARGGSWSYERWSNVYDKNMTKAIQANEAVNDYHQRIGGWGQREVTVNAGGYNRRLDIADVGSLRGIEYKTGYITRSQEINWEVARDKVLVQSGWDIEWVFRDRASEPLLNDLKEAGIRYRFDK